MPGSVIYSKLLGGEKPQGILSLLAQDETPHSEYPASPRSLASSITLLQALSDLGVSSPTWLVTRGAVSATPADTLVSAVQAQIWGLGRVVALEQPDRWGGLVDLPEIMDRQAGDRLAGVLCGGGDEDQVAVRSQGVFARRLVRAPSADRFARQPWVPQGAVLVTGGTGGLGSHVARWLARSGAEHLVLVSRSGRGCLRSDGA